MVYSPKRLFIVTMDKRNALRRDCIYNIEKKSQTFRHDWFILRVLHLPFEMG